MAEPAPLTAALGTPALSTWVSALRARYPRTLAAVLLYGSYLRGERDTVLDFYLLLDDYRELPGGRAARLANRLLPPNVYYLAPRDDACSPPAKVACVSLAAFERALAHDRHPYFRARFAQPCALLWAREAGFEARLASARGIGSRRLLAEVLPLLETEFAPADAWQRIFALTYACELRSEGTERAHEIYAHHADALNEQLAEAAPALGLQPAGRARWRQRAPGRAARLRARAAWVLRACLGKCLSAARLLKAAFTFDDPLSYVLWKVERHSGVRVAASDRQRRHPLLFGWGVLWRLYRRGGFR